MRKGKRIAALEAQVERILEREFLLCDEDDSLAKRVAKLEKAAAPPETATRSVRLRWGTLRVLRRPQDWATLSQANCTALEVMEAGPALSGEASDWEPGDIVLVPSGTTSGRAGTEALIRESDILGYLRPGKAVPDAVAE